ncbi:MAG: presenilin family intramembrane aspartyl protease [Candidatus Pacearchaeota archaeon]|nr:presenilin family intramembrane aspartyl protease [Candidatus Pacearchaeota archaeon]
MKHNLRITIIIVVMFIISQLIGLAIVASYDQFFGATHNKIVQQAKDQNITLAEPNISVTKELLPPPVEIQKPQSFSDALRNFGDISSLIISALIAFAIGALIFFLLLKFGVIKIVKWWFTIVILICLTIASTLILYPILGNTLVNILGAKFSLAEIIAVPLSLVLVFYKLIKKNLIVHNITELFVYPGLAILLIPMFKEVILATTLLLAISIYDIVAVWRSSYMVNLAKFQMEKLQIFGGFFVPYVNKKDRAQIRLIRAKIKAKKVKSSSSEVRNAASKIKVAALGGGDVAFPMIFLGSVFLTFGLVAYFITLITISLALLLLLLFSKKDTAYPAMPYLTAGSLLGLFIVLFFLI